MDNKRADLSKYRLQEAQDSLRVAEHCLKEEGCISAATIFPLSCDLISSDMPVLQL